jgi:diaminohydroxyphosphoribosylaminopyrimidine deaminase/5-amino-6-(5-phosphoribosylamino)uracil reductase
LKTRDLQSVLIEGGTEIAGAFCDAKLVDKLTFIFAPIIIGGNDAPFAVGGRGADSLENALRLHNAETTHHGSDFEITGYPKWNE